MAASSGFHDLGGTTLINGATITRAPSLANAAAAPPDWGRGRVRMTNRFLRLLGTGMILIFFQRQQREESKPAIPQN